MKYCLLFGTLIVLAVLVAACGAPVSLPSEVGPLATSAAGTAAAALATSSPMVGTVDAALATASPMIGDALATVSPAIGNAIGTLLSPAVVSTQPAGTTVSTAEIPVTGGTAIESRVAEPYGSILVDDQNRPLYLYTNDIQNGGTSACSDPECLAGWQPVTTVGMPVAGDAVNESMLGTIIREDGTVQVTYSGWPLYYDASGSQEAHNQDETWFLVTTRGNAASQ